MRKFHLPEFRKCYKTAIVVTCSILLSFIPSNGLPSRATTIEEAQEERNEAEENRKDAQNVLDSLEEAQNNLISEVAELDKQVSDLQTQITDKQAEADSLNEEIDETKIKLADAQVAEDDQYAAMMKRIQYLYENGEVEYIDTLMSSASFSDMLNKSEYVEQLSDFDQKQLNELVGTRQNIEDYESTLKRDLVQVESVQADLENQQEQLQSVMDEKNDKIAQYELDIDAQSALVAQYEKERDEADEKLAEIQKQTLAAQQSSGETTYYDPTYSGTFMWPAVSGSSISSSFGPRTSPTAGASSNHKGIDIPCPTGSDIVAGADGVVTVSQYSNSAGYYIMIDHGNGVATVYMHNSQLLVSVGESVVRGQVIAKAGSTGYSTGSHCHFGVMINGSYVNPLNYL
jgi:murein DD-endopeptidase MepM/ murein hydrolase activator NlpD